MVAAKSQVGEWFGMKQGELVSKGYDPRLDSGGRSQRS